MLNNYNTGMNLILSSPDGSIVNKVIAYPLSYIEGVQLGLSRYAIIDNKILFRTLSGRKYKIYIR